LSVPAEAEPALARAGEYARLFFALWPDAGLVSELSNIAKNFAERAGGRATRPETLHLTLAFLGDVPVARIAELRQLAGAITAPAFDLMLEQAGIWQHNRIFWLGCATPPALGSLVATLDGRLGDAGFRVRGAGHHFVPHLTMARKVDNLLAPLPATLRISWPCRHFVLVRSCLSAAGPAYETIADFTLVHD